MDAPGPVDPTRRRWLRAALIGLLAGPTLEGCAAAFRSLEQAGEASHWLAVLIDDADGMAGFGNAYLQAFPGERNLDRLAHALRAALDITSPEPAARQDAAALFARLDRTVRDEYRRGEVVTVAGWLLSRSEARLYAASTLL
jgi:hypothetical protein